MKKTLLAALAAALLFAAYYAYAPRHVPANQAPLASITSESFPEIQQAFNGAADRVRLLVLLSPT